MRKIIFALFVFVLITVQGNAEEYWKEIPYPSYIGDSGKLTSDGILNALAVEKSGVIWVGGGHGKIYCYKFGKWIQYLQDTTGLDDNYICEIMIDSKNRKWFLMQRPYGINDHVALMYDDDKWTSFDFYISPESSVIDQRLPFMYIIGCAEDKNGIIWFAGDKGIIELFPDMSYKTFTTANSGLPSNDICRVVVDGNNVKWFTAGGIGGGVLVSYDDKIWTVHEGYSISDIVVGKSNELCLGLGFPDAPGLMTYNGEWHRIGDYFVADMTSDSEGVFWLIINHDYAHNMYFKGIMRLDNTKVQWYDTVDENKVFYKSICIGPNNNKYIISYSEIKIFSDTSPVYVNESNSPCSFSLDAAYPNPFNPLTTISFFLPSQNNTELTVHSITGQRVRTLLSGPLSAGSHSVVWDGRDDSGKPVSSGVYLTRLTSGKQTASGKMLFLK